MENVLDCCGDSFPSDGVLVLRESYQFGERVVKFACFLSELERLRRKEEVPSSGGL